MLLVEPGVHMDQRVWTSGLHGIADGRELAVRTADLEELGRILLLILFEAGVQDRRLASELTRWIELADRLPVLASGSSSDQHRGLGQRRAVGIVGTMKPSRRLRSAAADSWILRVDRMFLRRSLTGAETDAVEIQAENLHVLRAVVLALGEHAHQQTEHRFGDVGDGLRRSGTSSAMM